MPNLIDTTTPLDAIETFDSGTIRVERGLTIVGSVFADKNGTLYIEQSTNDGVDWDVSTTYATVANDGKGFVETLVSNTFRIRFTNTAGTDQTTFRLVGNVRDADGDYVPAVPPGPGSGTRFFVIYYEPGAQKWVAQGDFESIDGSDANGLAAIRAHQSGKYASFDIANATVDDVALQDVADRTSVSFDPS